MSEGPQYTACIEKDAFVTVESHVGVANVLGAIGAILFLLAGFPAAGAILAFAAGAEILRKVAEWLLNRKLICLKNAKRRVFDDPDSDRICVLGAVLDFESVGADKSGFEAIDNDFALNLLLAPTPLSDIRVKSIADLTLAVEKTAQGDLIQNPDVADPAPPLDFPKPLLRKDNGQKFGAMPKGFIGYQRDLMVAPTYPRLIPMNLYFNPKGLALVDPLFAQLASNAHAQYVTEVQTSTGADGKPLSAIARNELLSKAAADPLSQPRVVELFYQLMLSAFAFETKRAPALHCEFEGARIRDVYNTLDFAHVQCDSSGFWGFLCDALNFVISLFLGLPKLIAAAVAWLLAKDGKLTDAYDGAGGELQFGDSIVLRGRWVYDGGHDGYNEIHAVRTVQKTFGPGPQDEAGFKAFHDQWCSELAKVPPNAALPEGTSSPANLRDPLTPAQLATYDAQSRPENRWTFHPSIDACSPRPSDPHPGLH